jgi:hypothetical protein
MKTRGENGGIALCILNLDTHFMQVASVYCGTLCSSEVSDIIHFLIFNVSIVFTSYSIPSDAHVISRGVHCQGGPLNLILNK